MPNSISGKTYALFPGSHNVKIISGLENAGAKVIKFPSIKAEKVSNQTLLEQLKNLASFDWIIFPDVLTVDFFLEILEENAIDFFDLDETRVCAFGEIVSDRLRFAQLHADVIPNTIEPESVLSALKNYMASEDLNNLKFLLTKKIHSVSRVEKQLLDAGAKVCEQPIYKINFSSEREIPKLKGLIKGGAIDEFIFTAPTDFIALRHVFNDDPLASVFAETEISCTDVSIYQIARENNLKNAGLFRTDKIDKVEK